METGRARPVLSAGRRAVGDVAHPAAMETGRRVAAQRTWRSSRGDAAMEILPRAAATADSQARRHAAQQGRDGDRPMRSVSRGCRACWRRCDHRRDGDRPRTAGVAVRRSAISASWQGPQWRPATYGRYCTVRGPWACSIWSCRNGVWPRSAGVSRQKASRGPRSKPQRRPAVFGRCRRPYGIGVPALPPRNGDRLRSAGVAQRQGRHTDPRRRPAMETSRIRPVLHPWLPLIDVTANKPRWRPVAYGRCCAASGRRLAGRARSRNRDQPRTAGVATPAPSTGCACARSRNGDRPRSADVATGP